LTKPDFLPSPSFNRSKTTFRNRSDIGWKHKIDINGNGKNVKCNYYPKSVSEGTFRFKHHLVITRKDSEPCVG